MEELLDTPYELTEAQIEEFVQNGVLVVRGVFPDAVVQRTRQELHTYLATQGVSDWQALSAPGDAEAMRALSSTKGAGGVLDVFYQPFQLRLQLSRRLFSILSQLWRHTYALGRHITFDHAGDRRGGENGAVEELFAHPFGQMDASRGIAYLDRICVRLPDTALPSGKRPMQRGLAPHLDCAGNALYKEDAQRWRPIQCFVPLTPNSEADTGGFECIKGFHRQFREYFETREAVCVGEFTRIRGDIVREMEHVPYEAGDVVLWDFRTPHANARRNHGATREVIYTGFLPPVPVNQRYAQEQLRRLRAGKRPVDQWVEHDDDETERRETVDLQRLRQCDTARMLLALD